MAKPVKYLTPQYSVYVEMTHVRVDTVSCERNTEDTVTGMKFETKYNSNKDLAGLYEKRVIIFRVF